MKGGRGRDGYDCLSIYGRRRTGKTTGGRAQLRQRKVSRYLVVTPFNDDFPEADLCTTAEEFHDRCEEAEDQERFAIVYCPSDETQTEAVERASEWALSLGFCVLVVDEAHASCSARNLDENAKVVLVAKQGGHFGVGLWCFGQRPADVAPALRSELEGYEAYYFRLKGSANLRHVAESHDKELAERVRKLPRLVCYRVTDDDTVERWQVRFVEDQPEMVQVVFK